MPSSFGAPTPCPSCTSSNVSIYVSCSTSRSLLFTDCISLSKVSQIGYFRIVCIRFAVHSNCMMMFQTSPSISSSILITVSLSRSTASTLPTIPIPFFVPSSPWEWAYSLYPAPIYIALRPLHCVSCSHHNTTCRFFLVMSCTTSPFPPVMFQVKRSERS